MKIFNFLPREKKLFLYETLKWEMGIFILLIFSVCTLIYWDQMLIWNKTNLLQRIIFFQNEIAHLNQQDKIQETKNSVNFKNEFSFKKMMNALFTAHGYDLCFTEITRSQEETYFSGKAKNALVLTEFLQNWPAAAFFSEIFVEQLTKTDQNMQFRLKAKENHFSGLTNDG